MNDASDTTIRSQLEIELQKLLDSWESTDRLAEPNGWTLEIRLKTVLRVLIQSEVERLAHLNARARSQE